MIACVHPQRRVLLVSFDLVRPDEPDVPLSIATLLAAATEGADDIELYHESFNLLNDAPLIPADVVERLSQVYVLSGLDVIALSAYVWGERLLVPVMRGLREAGFEGRLFLGGYEVSYSEDADLAARYPDADGFVKGYAETSLLEAVRDETGRRTFWSVPDFSALPSPYLTGVLPVAQGQVRVRMETKRGCPYRCSFCAHRDLRQNRVHRYQGGRALREFAFLEARGVQKINVLDPVFNMGTQPLNLLEALACRSYRPHLSLQCRIENIRGPLGERFLEVCSALNVTLEFGLQSIHDDELGAVERKNNLAHTRHVLGRLGRRGIPYEVSLIYGMPHQTVASFRSAIDFVRDAGCTSVVAFPLMLLRGTELHERRAEYGFDEQPMGTFGIPTVRSSNSFTADDWWQMHEIAAGLGEIERV